MNKRSQVIQEKQTKLRREMFGEDSDDRIWTLDEKGFGSIPRTMSLIMSLFPELCGKKSNPSQTYVDLWCLSWDGGLVEIRNEKDRAYASGYSSSRRVRSWRERMSELEKLGFIETRPRGGETYGYVMLVNPYLVIKKLIDEKAVSDAWKGAFLGRMNEIGVSFPEPPENKKKPASKRKRRVI